MNPTIEKIMKGEVVVKTFANHWEISSIGTRFLDWMRQNYKETEDNTWQVYYYSGTMCIVQTIDSKIITMVNLKWL